MYHPINHALIKIVGVFAFDYKKDIPMFKQSNYDSMQLVDLPIALKSQGKEVSTKAINDTKVNYKNTYYSEFRDFMFTGEEQSHKEGYQKKQIRTFRRKKTLKGNFEHKRFDHAARDFVDAPSIPFESEIQELFLFPGGIGMFALILEPKEHTLEYISDLINKARNFDSKVLTSQSITFDKWISKELLCGIPLTGDKLELDEFSGSKFKVYTVIDMPAPSESFLYNRDHLLYEIGTSSPLGVVRTDHRLSPSDSYYEELMENKVSAFRNYEGLALLDSFTVIGQGNYTSFSDESESYVQYHQWNRVYFGIYIYNLFIRYSLFKYNSKYLLDPLKYRAEFQDFINLYNFNHISFNFLPNLIFERIRNALRIEEEVIVFEKRLSGLATSIQEVQEKRQALLLTIISVISTFEAMDVIGSNLYKIRIALGLTPLVFYLILFLIGISVLSVVGSYLFPNHAQKFKRKIRKLLISSTKK